MSEKGKAYLVGAGPGDPELMTLKAVKLLRGADVVLYDELINSDILNFVRSECILINVGKRCGQHPVPQEKINEMLVENARNGHCVVRLKGGDPFVFGRGGEEILALLEHGIGFEVVPGISSSIAAASYAGIPVTHRGIATSFAVITGHSANGEACDVKWESFGGVDTLVILMGVMNRQAIAQELIRAGKNADEAVAFIHRGTTERQTVISTNLKVVAENPPEVSPPAIMIVGRVVEFHKAFNWFEPYKTAKNTIQILEEISQAY